MGAYTSRNQLVEQLRRSVSIIDLARRLGLSVAQRGKSHLTLCPFHQDKTPSLNLFDEEGGAPHYHCFACGAHGDVFSLVQHVNKLDFRAAVDWLAQNYGLTNSSQAFVSSVNQTTGVPPTLTSSRFHGLSAALELFSENNDKKELASILATRNFPASVGIAAELAVIRNGTLSRAITEAQNRGDDWRTLQGDLEAAGLVRVGYSPEGLTGSQHLDLPSINRDFYYDNRLIFPVRDSNAQLQGFAGRRLLDNSQTTPKYLFSPGLPKSGLLYRSEVAFSLVNETRSSPDQYRHLYICEGLFDALRLESFGFAAVALLGASASDRQIKYIVTLGNRLPQTHSLRCKVFLDRDDAGQKGAAKLVRQLSAQSIDADLVWPTGADLDQLSIPIDSRKDPDQLLQRLSPAEARVQIAKWSRPAAVALLAEQLGETPDDILDDKAWGSISRSRRHRATYSIQEGAPEVLQSLKNFSSVSASEYPAWLADVDAFLRGDTTRPLGENETQRFIENPEANLNLARSLARSGAARGDMAHDLATWRRIDIAATAFNEAFQSRLQQGNFQPIEPFDSIYISRAFGKVEPRLKVMPCPEDLIVQQYILNELLTARHDIATGSRTFSSYIPAVRYYRSRDKTLTTGVQDATDREPLSFAYQIDVDVLEGRTPAAGNGMFRPYFHCWRDFVKQLRSHGSEMSQVHVLRLDVRRYYDEIRRSVIRNALRAPITHALDTMSNVDSWAPLFRPTAMNLSKADVVVDWICDQSFEYKYYDPATGDVHACAREQGIPQGPVLSAWLGTIALFPLDEAIRSVLTRFNVKGQQRKAAYARYVDDVVLLAESHEILSVMRATAEDAVRKLSLQIVPKSDPVPPMFPDEFAVFLTQGRSLGVSQPDSEPVLFNAGDGESGWDTYGWNGAEEIQRDTALQLLHDRRLYSADASMVVKQLYTALRSPDLRPKDLAKAARWLWYHAAKESAEDAKPNEVLDRMPLT